MKQLLLFFFAILFIWNCKPETATSTKGKMIKTIKKEVVYTTNGEEIALGNDSLVKIIYLIRHAEKDTAKNDPYLNKTGLDRAAKLTQIMRQTFLDGVYTTYSNRTVQTIDSITQYKGLSMQIYSNESLKARFSEVKTSPELNRVLVVGHSNNIPAIANYLSESKYFTKIIDEKVFDNFYIVTRYRGGSSKVWEFKY
jgi:2,3-bisphosphoglycerate-dependent phosphoglycerate mutase